jgi:hypothetical protein
MWCYKGASPKELAPEQFKVARYKLRSVETELKNSNWIKNLKEVSSESHLEEFILLFMALAPQSLSNHSGKITWKWTTHGQYSAASTYECQFLGSMSAFSDINLWKAVAEQKMKFFAWLVFHDRVLTTDNMAKRGWECNPMCSFCYCQFETTPTCYATATMQKQCGTWWLSGLVSQFTRTSTLVQALLTSYVELREDNL